MNSYEERLATFSAWPDEFKPVFVKKLALMGQYSLQHEMLSTKCIFCDKKLEDWHLNDEPFAEHYLHNNGCLLFRLGRAESRKKMMEIQVCSTQHEEVPHAALSRGVFGQINLRKGIPFYFCLKCGASKLSHRCTRRFLRHVRTHNSSDGFYIRLFKGEFLSAIDSYMENDVFVPEPARDILQYIFEHTDPNAFETLDSFISRGVDHLVRSFSSETKTLKLESIEDALKKTN